MIAKFYAKWPKVAREASGRMDTQVLVIGAGPVGLTLAIDLGLRGVRCTLIEQKMAPAKLPKMARCNARTMDIYRRMGSRFIPNSPARKVTPVTLPPGRLRLRTKPSETGSLPLAKMIGTRLGHGLRGECRIGISEQKLRWVANLARIKRR